MSLLTATAIGCSPTMPIGTKPSQVDRHLSFLLDRQHGVGRSLGHVERIAVVRHVGGGLAQPACRPHPGD